jgi:hypothetical protein
LAKIIPLLFAIVPEHVAGIIVAVIGTLVSDITVTTVLAGQLLERSTTVTVYVPAIETVEVCAALVKLPGPLHEYPAFVAEVAAVNVALKLEQVIVPVAVAVTVGIEVSVRTATVLEAEQPLVISVTVKV